MATKIPPRRVIGRGNVSAADAAAAAFDRTQYDYYNQLPNPYVVTPTIDNPPPPPVLTDAAINTPNQGATPIGVGEVGADIGAGSVPGLPPGYDPTQVPVPPTLLTPEYNMTALPQYAPDGTPLPEYGKSWDYKNDNRNLLTALSILGATGNYGAFNAAAQAGTQGVERNEDRRVRTAAQKRSEKKAAADAQYQADLDRYKLASGETENKNQANAQYNNNARGVYGNQLTAYAAEQGRQAQEKKTRIAGLLKQSVPLFNAIINRSEKNLTPEDAKKLVEHYNKLQSRLSLEGVSIEDTLPDLEIQGTNIDMLREKLASAKSIADARNATSRANTKDIVGSGLLKNREDNALVLKMAKMRDDTQRDLAAMNDATDRLGLRYRNEDSVADRKLKTEQWLEQRKVQKNSPNWTRFNSLSSQLGQMRSDFQKTTEDIIKYQAANPKNFAPDGTALTNDPPYINLVRTRDRYNKEIMRLNNRMVDVSSEIEKNAGGYNTTTTTGGRTSTGESTSSSTKRPAGAPTGNPLKGKQTPGTSTKPPKRVSNVQNPMKNVQAPPTPSSLPRRRPAAGAGKAPLVIPTKGRKTRTVNGYTYSYTVRD